MSGNSSQPGGNMFSSTVNTQGNNENGNQNQNNDGNDANSNENNSIESLALQLTSGVVLGETNPADGKGQAKPNDQTTETTDQTTTQKEGEPHPVVANLMKTFKGEAITDGVNIEDIGEKMQNGDLSGLVDAMGATANKAVERALTSVLDLIPEIINNTEQRVLAKVGQLNSSDRVWDNFLALHPDYAAHKGTVRDHLQKAIDGGASEEQAYAAVDMIFGNLKKKKTDKAPAFTPESGSEAFNLTDYTGG